MIINWLLYSVLAGSMLVAAGFASEYAIRALRLPTRWVWAAVLVLSSAFSVITLLKLMSPGEQSAPAIETAYGYDKPGGVIIKVTPIEQPKPGIAQIINGTVFRSIGGLIHAPVGVDEFAYMPFDQPVLIACGVIAIVGLITLCITIARLNGVSYALNNAVVEGVPVLLSRNIGPALLGVFRFRVVLPRWVTEMSPADLRMILKHEQEHALAGDPTLTLGALCLVAIQPWNLPMWIAMSRLRLAIESDCDARVLGPDGDVRQYGKLLVKVYERAQSGVTPLTALVRGTSQLEARIRRMVDAAPRTFSPKTVMALIAAFTLSAFAYSLEVTAQRPARKSQVDTVRVERFAPARKRQFVPDSSVAIDSALVRARAKRYGRIASASSAPARKRIERFVSDTPPAPRRKVDTSVYVGEQDYKSRRIDSLRRNAGAIVTTQNRSKYPARAQTSQSKNPSRLKTVQRKSNRQDSIITIKARAAYDVMTVEEKRQFELRARRARIKQAKPDTGGVYMSDSSSARVFYESAPMRGSGGAARAMAAPTLARPDSMMPRGSGRSAGAIMSPAPASLQIRGGRLVADSSTPPARGQGAQRRVPPDSLFR